MVDPATMTSPVRLSGPDPRYTREALAKGTSGTAIVRCVIETDGSVTRCKVLKSLPGMDAALVETFQSRHYKPATQNGKPVRVLYMFKVTLQPPR